MEFKGCTVFRAGDAHQCNYSKASPKTGLLLVHIYFYDFTYTRRTVRKPDMKLLFDVTNLRFEQT